MTKPTFEDVAALAEPEARVMMVKVLARPKEDKPGYHSEPDPEFLLIALSMMVSLRSIAWSLGEISTKYHQG